MASQRGGALTALLARIGRERRLPPLVTVSSDEALLALEAQDALRAAAREHGYTEREVLNADARFDWSRLTEVRRGLSLFAERRIVEVRLPGGKPGVAGAAALETLGNEPIEEVFTLVALPRLDRRTRETRWASALARGVWLDIDPIDRAALPGWIGERLARQGQRASAEALDFLAERVEGNLLAAHQEVVKLGLLHPAGELTIAQVAEAVLNVARYDVFQLPLAMLAGDGTRVVRTMDGLRAEGEALPLVVWAIAEELRTLLRVRALVDAGRPFAAAAREQRVWGPREGLMARAITRLDARRLARALHRTADVDRVAKGLRAARADSDAWLELTDVALSIAR